MKSTEVKLKKLILANYKSIREFAAAIQMPYSTIDSIFKRGVANASITNIIKICAKLDISADLLAKGKLQKAAEETNLYSCSEVKLVNNFRFLNEEGQEKAVDYISDLVDTGKYKQEDLIDAHIPDIENIDEEAEQIKRKLSISADSKK
ncbi:MAG: helix-turn-helix transcriptional regulator [Hydrogenoanaerobacterium sp.]